MIVMAIKPSLVGNAESFLAKASHYAAAVRGARVLPGHEAIRVPYDRSLANRRRHQAQGCVTVADEVLSELRRLLAQRSGSASGPA